MMKQIGWVSLALLLAACGNSDVDNKTVQVQVAPQEVACTGITKQRCLEVRFADNESWQLYYGSIKGFTFKPGFQYLLEVRQQHQQQDNPNESQLAWELVKEVSRTPVTLPTSAPAAASLPTVTAQPAPEKQD